MTAESCWNQPIILQTTINIDAMNDRSYTYIDAGTAIIGNRWCERRWSSFMGYSTEITCLTSDINWLASNNTEFVIHYDKDILGLRDLGEIAWSEEANSHMAVLECRKSNGAMVLVTRSTIFHGSPGILRKSYLANVSEKPGNFLAAVTDTIFPLDDMLRAEVLHYNPRIAADRDITGLIRSNPPPLTVSLWRKDGGLIIGTEGPGGFVAQLENKGEIALVAYCPTTLFPGGILHLPESYIIPFRGANEEARKRAHGDFVRARREWMDWSQARERA